MKLLDRVSLSLISGLLLCSLYAVTSHADTTDNKGFLSFDASDSTGNATEASAGGEEVSSNPDASSVTWLYYLALLVVISAFTVSPITAVLLWIRRDTYPLYVLNIPVMIFNEMLMPLAVWGAVLNVITPWMPCWLSIFCWNLGLVPLIGSLLVSIVKLYVDHTFNAHMVHNRKDSWVVRNITTIRNPKVLSAIGVVSWIYCWFPQIERMIRLAPYLNYGETTSECVDWTGYEYENTYDMANWVIFPWGTAMLSIFLLKGVKEAFNMKKRFVISTVQLWIGVAAYYTGFYVYDLVDEDTYVIIAGATTFWLALALHLCTWCFPVSALWASYTYERERKRRQSFVLSSSSIRIEPDNKDGLGAAGDGGAGQPKKKSNSREELQSLMKDPEFIKTFKEYLIKELCVENIFYLIASSNFRSAQSSADRHASATAIVRDHITEGSLLEVNISHTLRLDTLKRFNEMESGGEELPVTFWEEVDDEIFKLLLEPYHRFLRVRERRASMSKAHEGKQVLPAEEANKKR